MTYLIVLVLLLVLLAGVIAFLGDRLGTWAGRNRLSLFGVRPRRTGQIIGVMAGILIMLTTLGVLALANRNATATLVNAQQAAQELVELRAEQRVLMGQVRDMERELEDGAAALASVTEQRDHAQAELEAAAQVLDQLASEQSLLEQELTGLRSSMTEVQEFLETVQVRLQVAQQQLEAATQRQVTAENEASRAQAVAAEAEAEVAALEAETAELEQVIAGLGTEITSLREQSARLRDESELLQGENAALSSSNAELAASNSQLSEQNALLADVNNTLRLRFEESNARVQELEANLQVLELSMEDSTRRLVDLQGELEQIAAGEIAYRAGELIYSGTIQASGIPAAREALAALVRSANEVTARRGAGAVQLSPTQFDSLAALVAESEQELIIALISPGNQLRTATVEVTVEAYENTQVLGGGQLVSSRRIHLGSVDQPLSQAEIMSLVLGLVQDTRNRLTLAGFFSQEAPEFLASEDGFVRQLARMTGQTTIGVVTREPVYRGGPARLEFIIIN